MLLEKIKQHAGKFLFFSLNLLLIGTGAMFIKQKALEKDLAKAQAEKADLIKMQTATQSVSAVQNDIAADRQQKLDGVANNTGTVTAQQTVPVTKTVPGAVRTVTVPETTTSSTATSKTTTSPTKTTKTS